MVNQSAVCDSIAPAGISRPSGKAEVSRAHLGSAAALAGGAAGFGTPLPLWGDAARAAAQPYRAAVRPTGHPGRDRPRGWLFAGQRPADLEAVRSARPHRPARAGSPALVRQAAQSRLVEGAGG